MLLLFLLVGCVKTVPGLTSDTGASHTSDTDPVDLSTIDPDTLPQGDSPCREPELVWVYAVIDGDTVHVDSSQGEESIRMIGVDAPEVGWDGAPSDCYGLEAQVFSRNTLEDQEVWLTFDGTCTDLYDRSLAYIHLGSGDQDFFQRRLLRGGYAWDYPWSGTDTFEDTFAEDAFSAEASGEGLWGLCD